MTITSEVAAKLREKFDAEKIGKKPKITCRACSNAQSRVCSEHKKKACPPAPQGCGQWITEKHMHVDFVGHANVTDRLLEVDPEWTWEPMAFGPDGLPAMDSNGGLWIRLTICGVTRIGYGGADGKRGDDAVKEAIGDAIKVAAMRFGVALDLWRKEEASGKSPAMPEGRTVGRGEPPAEPPKRTAADARAHLAADAKRNSWDLDRIARLFEEQHDGRSIAEAENPQTIDKFREGLYAVSDQELKAPAANGAAQ